MSWQAKTNYGTGSFTELSDLAPIVSAVGAFLPPFAPPQYHDRDSISSLRCRTNKTGWKKENLLKKKLVPTSSE